MSRIIKVPIGGGERFPAVSLFDGQGVRVVLSNVLVPASGTTPTECPVLVRFFGADGALIGDARTVRLRPGASVSVPAAPSSGLVRAIVSVTADASNPNKIADPRGICAIRTTLEVFDVGTGRTLFLIPSSNACLGNGACSATLPPARGRRVKKG
jgi:hypothetical protein